MRSRTNHAKRNVASRGAQRAFTLLEVLVAMFVLGTAISSLFVLMSRSLSNEARAEAVNRALMLGQAKFNEILISHRGSDDPSASRLEVGNSISGQWDELTRWEAAARSANDRSTAITSQVSPVQIMFTVYWKRDLQSRENSLLLETTQLWARVSTAGDGAGQ